MKSSDRAAVADGALVFARPSTAPRPPAATGRPPILDDASRARFARRASALRGGRAPQEAYEQALTGLARAAATLRRDDIDADRRDRAEDDVAHWAYAAHQEGLSAGWSASEVRADIAAAEAPPAPRADRDGAPAPTLRSTMGAVSDTPGRMRPSRVGRDAAVDGHVVEWSPGLGRIAPTRGVFTAPALTPREVSALRKKERRGEPVDPARAAREAAEEAVRSERIRRDRDLRRRAYGK
jgi:hypothetical protein